MRLFRHSALVAAVGAALAVGAAGCGDSVSVSNASPRGSVGGIVINAGTGAALGGATVTVVAGGEVFTAVTTEADGTFGVDDVPAGSVLVTIVGPAGFWGATVRGMLGGAAGDFPVDNEALTLGPIALLPAATTFTVRILGEDAQPASGYEVGLVTTLEWVDYTWGVPNAMGWRGFSATTDADGYATFNNPPLPDYWRLGDAVNDAVVVTLPPRDGDGDGVFEFPGGSQAFNLRTLADPTPDVVLEPGLATSLSVVASTISALEPGGFTNPIATVINASDDVYIKFNLPIEGNSLDVNVVNETGAGVLATPTVTDDLLKIDFDTLTAGAEYNLHVHAVASVGDRIVEGDFAAPFFTRNAADTVAVTAAKDPSTGAVRLTFSEPIGTGVPGNNYLAGSAPNENCVLFFNADLDGSGIPIGNAPGELGNQYCEGGRAFYAVEPDPQGPVGASGYSSIWEFYPPTPAGVPLAPATPIHIFFSHVTNPSYIIERADGRPVNDFTGGQAIFMP